MIKIAWFGLAPWEKEYYQNKGIFAALGLTPVFVEGIVNDDNLPSGEAAESESISIFVDSAITATVLAAFPNLKYIVSRSTGFDHIDIAACQARGITVAYVPGYGEVTVAEYTFAILLALTRKVYEGFDRIRETGEFSPKGLKGFDLNGKTLGIIGTGRIGKHVAQIANGFGMKILAYDIFPDQAAAQRLNFTYVSLEDLLKNSDIVTVHTPYTPENHHLIDAAKLALMKSNAILVNTARGPLVDTVALVTALKTKKLGGAALDVLEEEGVLKDEFGYLARPNEGVDLKAVLAEHVLFDLPNVIITPHNAFNSQEALERILDTTADNIKTYLAGTPANVVK